MRREYQFFVYILASKKNGTLYTGVTNSIERRIWEHKNDINDGFTKKYGVHDLVYFEPQQNILEAKKRENQIKRWKRQWKLALIEKENPSWNDLSKDWERVCFAGLDPVNSHVNSCSGRRIKSGETNRYSSRLKRNICTLRLMSGP